MKIVYRLNSSWRWIRRSNYHAMNQTRFCLANFWFFSSSKFNFILYFGWTLTRECARACVHAGLTIRKNIDGHSQCHIRDVIWCDVSGRRHDMKGLPVDIDFACDHRSFLFFCMTVFNEWSKHATDKTRNDRKSSRYFSGSLSVAFVFFV